MKSVTLKIVISYAFAGILWITISDVVFIIAEGQKDHPVLVMGSISGAFFLLVTSIILHKLITIHFNRLQQSEQKYRSYFEDNPIPMWMYDRKTLRFIDVNTAAVHNYGYTKEEFRQMSILDIRPAEDREKVISAVHSYESNYKNSGVWNHRRKDGSDIFVQISSHLTYLPNGIHIMVMAKDITKRLQAEMQLQQVNQNLIRQNNTLKEISWSESHNVRRPLSSILGLLDVLRMSTDEKEKELCINYIEISAAELDIMIHKVSEQINNAVMLENNNDIPQRSIPVAEVL